MFYNELGVLGRNFSAFLFSFEKTKKTFKKGLHFLLTFAILIKLNRGNEMKRVGSELSWIECLTTNQKVVGSNPAGLTSKTA